MPAGKDGKSVPENPITPSSVHFAVAASEAANSGTDTPESLGGDVAKNLPKTSTPYPKEDLDHQLSISRIACAVEQSTEHKDGPAAKRRREVSTFTSAHVTILPLQIDDDDTHSAVTSKLLSHNLYSSSMYV